MRRLILIAILIAALPAVPQASTRSYTLPTDGAAVSACLSDGECGKAAADHFCKMAGYSESILFSRQPVASAIIIDGNRRCEGESCEAFTRIKCYTPAEDEQASVE